MRSAGAPPTAQAALDSACLSIGMDDVVPSDVTGFRGLIVCTGTPTSVRIVCSWSLDVTYITRPTIYVLRTDSEPPRGAGRRRWVVAAFSGVSRAIHLSKSAHCS